MLAGPDGMVAVGTAAVVREVAAASKPAAVEAATDVRRLGS
jgi:hypothetical protein